MKFRKGYLFLLALLIAAGVMANYVYSDISLDVDLLRESLSSVPVVVLENLEFEREISGDRWQAWIPVARRHSDIIEVQSMDVLRRLANGREWFFMGSRGFYSQTAKSADVTGLLGTLETDERVFNLESPYLSWSNDTNVFLFPRGLIMYDAEFSLETDLASVDASGVMTLEEGGVIRWRKAIE